MAVITVSSDLGENNYCSAALMSAFKEVFKSQVVIELFHQRDTHDMESMAYQIIGALNQFSDNTIHIVFSKYSLVRYHLIGLRLKNQFILSSDNGLISLLNDIDYQTEVYQFPSSLSSFDFYYYLQHFLKTTQGILDNTINGTLASDYIQLKPLNTGLLVTSDRIVCRVIYIYDSGNIILNIQREGFESAVGKNPFYILFHTVKIRAISVNYMITETNNRMGAIFNESGFLEIFMVGGNIAKLFGINKYSNNKIEIIIGHDTDRQIEF